ncbi:transcription repressor MYB5-like [Canna indica]|uniref:Transcription repressor MYB5-like n=1 Tax=Canna indica TaxID=4628 RepID=A0AAQ3K583_9LILI|nr:transcription repressor MYB5-like [Canna indica]
MSQLCMRISLKEKPEANKPPSADSSSDYEAVTRAAEQPTFLIKTKVVRCSKRSKLTHNENTPSSVSVLQVVDPTCCFFEDFDMEELISGFPVDDAFLQLCVDDGHSVPGGSFKERERDFTHEAVQR